MTRELICTDCGLFGEFESFKRDDARADIEYCPACGSGDVKVEVAPDVFEVELVEEVSG